MDRNWIIFWLQVFHGLYTPDASLIDNLQAIGAAIRTDEWEIGRLEMKTYRENSICSSMGCIEKILLYSMTFETFWRFLPCYGLSFFVLYNDDSP